jgi:hypothetical protein
MTTITINERTKAGKTLLELAKLLATTNKGVAIDDSGLAKAATKNKELTLKQKKWIDGLKKVATDVKSGTFKGKSAQSFLNEL